ncbi:MAG: 2-oxoglutarate dehydrogenase E1 component [Flavobacteriales bacterium]|nr:2-oxoglutarate dehydrogenase E1 component [Flavobacteriales bacterium]
MSDQLSFLGNAHGDAIEALYQQYKANPESVDTSWQRFFEGFEFQRADFEGDSEFHGEFPREFKVINLINGYRSRGHLFTKTNPVRERRKYSPTLDIEHFGLNESDLKTVFEAGKEIGLGPATLEDIVHHLEETYCQSIGIEYMYIRHPERQQWIRDRIELKNRTQFSKEEKLRIFKKLNQATVFEQFLQRKFVGQKRFSVEGGEALIPALDTIVQKGASLGVKEIVMGMAHRGRLNTLAHLFDKPYAHIFSEFEGKEYDDDGIFDGDVKYHLGYSTDVESKKGEKVHLTLCPNPSHLEAVNPVVEGLTRAKIDQYLKDEKSIVPVLVHGDAAIAGQGIMYEVVQMAQLDGYRTGGTIHIVVNNQVGFTTNYLDGRSSTYCTDVGKTTLCPVFHVNADDVEAVVEVMNIAVEYRQQYNMDVFVDLLGFRKYGHNEGDEPKFTQPKLYQAIASHDTAREIYVKQLLKEGILTEADAEQARKDLEMDLESRYDESKSESKAYVKHFLEDTWTGVRYAKPEDFDKSPDTGYDLKALQQLGKQMATLPEDKKYFRKIAKLMQDRIDMIERNELDWGMGEMLAYATILADGAPVRISGQDVERGTFSHRHAVVKVEDTEEEVIPLNNLSKKQGEFTIYNSLLSEYGVLGFDYGYAYGNPTGLTVWEAQFGDFNNGAQIIIDQFLSAAEDKWRTMNGLVMLLPHGYEGMGSEHSSGRMERYLQLCAEYNMVVCNCTTPANFFHLLRRQVKWDFRKPAIVFTPKKLLRYPKAVSKMEDLAHGRFIEVIDDASVVKSEVDTVAICTGKLYYDILEEKERLSRGKNIAVIRMEQLYPFPEHQLQEVLAGYDADVQLLWIQEEPENMGAWSYILQQMRSTNINQITRPASGSPAAGSPRIHEHRQQVILDKLFAYATELVKS